MKKEEHTSADDILLAMQVVRGEIKQNGFCLERAKRLKKLIGSGKVCTFDYQGVPADEIRPESCPHIAIPYSPGYYNGRLDWLYHSVYVNNGMVYAFELKNPVSFEQYCDELSRCTYNHLKDKNSDLGITFASEVSDRKPLLRQLIKDGVFKVPYTMS